MYLWGIIRNTYSFMWDNNSVLKNIYINSIEEGPSLGYVHLASYQTNFPPADMNLTGLSSHQPFNIFALFTSNLVVPRTNNIFNQSKIRLVLCECNLKCSLVYLDFPIWQDHHNSINPILLQARNSPLTLEMDHTTRVYVPQPFSNRCVGSLMSRSNKLIRKDEGDKAYDLTSLPNNVIIWTEKYNLN